MRFEEAVNILKKMHGDMLKKKEGGCAAFLFGLYFSEEIKGMEGRKLCRAAGISESYATEMYRGRKLVPYVDLKPSVKEKLSVLR